VGGRQSGRFNAEKIDETRSTLRKVFRALAQFATGDGL
jgi:hypothetical protein